MHKILILSGSPKKNGNTSVIAEWLAQACRAKGADVEVVPVADLAFKGHGCNACRACQKADAFECVIDDQASAVLKKMAQADTIVMATPMFFFGPSAQLKHIIDRMFSLYKWDNQTGSMRTVLQGKTLALLASSYEAPGLDALVRPFEIIAEYSGMRYSSLLIPGAGVSGEVGNMPDIRKKVVEFGAALV